MSTFVIAGKNLVQSRLSSCLSRTRPDIASLNPTVDANASYRGKQLSTPRGWIFYRLVKITSPFLFGEIMWFSLDPNGIAKLLRVFLSNILYRKNRLSQSFQVLPPALLFTAPLLAFAEEFVSMRQFIIYLPTCCSCTSIFCSSRLLPFLFSHLSFPAVLRSVSSRYQVRLAHSPAPFDAQMKPSGDPSQLRGPLPRQARNGPHCRRATDGNLARNGRAADVKSLSRSRCYLPPDICLRRRGAGGNQRGCDMEGKQWRVLSRRTGPKRGIPLSFQKILWWKCKCVHHDRNLRRARKVRSDPLYMIVHDLKEDFSCSNPLNIVFLCWYSIPNNSRGVPQGSVLGPFLFTTVDVTFLHQNDLMSVV